MWKKAFSSRLLPSVVALLLLAPPALGWRGVIECAQRCHLARTEGAHCPLMYNVLHAHPQHHCHEPQAVSVQGEFRCACPLSSSPAAPPNLVEVYFLAPPPFTLGVTLGHPYHLTELVGTPLFTVLAPPDPPPRAWLSMSL